MTKFPLFCDEGACSRRAVGLSLFSASPKTSVGASLLALAVFQPTSMLSVSSSSRARSLPQVL
ncbi:hypothetical protein F7R15_22610 [Pseudomonas reinekei]|uniref:Uncharacterized protein n=1 Tax=Pseudomonas reinekei TaxID=395598 RepID=A0A6H9R8I6_PSERE|nr:hypothetical protein F7R15_22610 [Pseudomonas reinekei]